MFTHTYQICGTKFQSQSNRAKYCVYCRDKAQVLRNKEYKEKKAAGTSIAVGSRADLSDLQSALYGHKRFSEVL